MESGERPGAIARIAFKAVREALFARHLAGAGGLEIAHSLTASADALMRALYRYADEP